MSALLDFAVVPIGAIHKTNAGVRFRDIPTGNAGRGRRRPARRAGAGGERLV
jgi:hypothetical protein